MAVTTANFPTVTKDGTETFYGNRYLKVFEKERKKRLKRMKKCKDDDMDCQIRVSRDESNDGIIGSSSLVYGKNPSNCKVLSPPDLSCNRSNLVLYKGKKRRKKPKNEAFIGRSGLKLLDGRVK